jgi:hypothetical protein
MCQQYIFHVPAQIDYGVELNATICSGMEMGYMISILSDNVDNVLDFSTVLYISLLIYSIALLS